MKGGKARGKEEKEAKQKVLKQKPVKASIRQRRYVRAVLDGHSGRQAARIAGYAPGTAARATVQIESKPAVQNVFVAILEKAGLTDELLAKRLREGIDAKETKFFAREGIVTDKRTVIDLGMRHTYTQTALKIKGHLVDHTHVTGQLALAELIALSFEKPKEPKDDEKVIDVEATTET